MFTTFIKRSPFVLKDKNHLTVAIYRTMKDAALSGCPIGMDLGCYEYYENDSGGYAGFWRGPEYILQDTAGQHIDPDVLRVLARSQRFTDTSPSRMPGRRRRRRRYYRHPRLYAELRQIQVIDDGEPAYRRKKKDLACAQFDSVRSDRDNNNWKRYRRHQHKNS